MEAKTSTQIILQRLKEIDFLIEKNNKLAEKYPEDNFLVLNKIQLKYQKEVLAKELE